MALKILPLARTDRNQGRLSAALDIYRRTILPEAQNPERQILYWIDHSKDDLADEFRCFAIQNGRDVIGYLQYTFFREEHTFFFEYLCIQDSRRPGLTPSHAVRDLEEFLAQNYRPDFTIVFEVARIRQANGAWDPDTRLLSYFRRLGFRKVDFEYRYPILQSYDGATSYPADLMIRLPRSRIEVTTSELRAILRCIYFRHYLRWDRPFLEPDRFTERERLINELYTRQTEIIGRSDKFDTSGDDRRARILRFASVQPPLAALANRVFGPKLPRICGVISLLLVVRWALGSTWLLIPFVPAVAAIYCLAEDTEASRKLFKVLATRLKFARPRTS